MTKVAAAGQLQMSNALHFGHGADGGGSKISCGGLKRKTPSELREELLKRKKPVEIVVESSPFVDLKKKSNGTGPKKSDSPKVPRFTRMEEHFPITKASRLLSRMEKSKGTVLGKSFDTMENPSFPISLDAKPQIPNPCLNDSDAYQGANDSCNQANNSVEKCSSNTFKSVRELSLGGEKLNGSLAVDMGKALRGLISSEPKASAPHAEHIDKIGSILPHSFSPELHIPERMIPLDLTLKTSMRLLSSSSVNWFHRLINCTSLNGTNLFPQVDNGSQTMTGSPDPTSTTQVINPRAFCSWVHPQSSLPREVISALNLAPGGQVDFLSKRQEVWQDAFRSLYYMLRKKSCKIFYVCTPQFVVMFTASDAPNKMKCSCSAYISQSTRNLRSLLKEHDVSFSMPLCHSKVEEVTAEDLVELSEIEKQNLGQTRAMETMAGVDSTPQSLLMITGNKNVHSLYDFLLNYRSFLSSLTGGDVPVLYSSVPFGNSAISTPEVKCKQVRRVDSPFDTEFNRTSSAGMCYSVEIKDAILPPWVISGMCNAMSSTGEGFQASFVTEATSIGLNAGLEDINKEKSDNCFDIPNTSLSLQKRSAFLKGLRYDNDGSLTALLSPAE